MASTPQWAPSKTPDEWGAEPSARDLVVPSYRLPKETVDGFWKRVAQLTARTQFKQERIASTELRDWNTRHLMPCNNCLHSKKKHICSVDWDHFSCRTCRTLRINCDRKAQFIFDATKEHFFSSFDQFIAVYMCKQPGKMRNAKMTENRKRKRNMSSHAETSKGMTTVFLTDGAVNMCRECLRAFEYDPPLDQFAFSPEHPQEDGDRLQKRKAAVENHQNEAAYRCTAPTCEWPMHIALRHSAS
ncbi:hypothetical protein FB451DRAFT_1264353 [Mycena latifolia]|nr:hypothetical protein FB451DRAFT_1264353 [Mycena latifolia]